MQNLRGQLTANGGLPPYSSDSIAAAADTLAQNPELESAVLDNPDAANDIVGLLPSPLQARAASDPAFRRQASRLVMTNIRAAHDWEQKRTEWLSRNNVLMAEFFDRTLVALAYQERNNRIARMADLQAHGDPRCANVAACTTDEALTIANGEIAQRIRQTVWKATAEHEIGHTFGLRHNFEGSFDAVNYFDNYWDLRKDSLTGAAERRDEGAAHPGRPARHLGRPGDSARHQPLRRRRQPRGAPGGGMHNYEYSSIMDYAGKITGDWQGVGKYDEAAIIFAYSGDHEARLRRGVQRRAQGHAGLPQLRHRRRTAGR